MCLGIPGKVIETFSEQGVLMGRIDFGGVIKTACLDHVVDIRVGEYVLIHVGFALARLDEAEAMRIFEMFQELGQLQELEEQG